MKDAAPRALPKVSVCIPVYNGLPYLESTLQSVLDQSFQDFEILIRDDRSTDGTFGWLQERFGGDPRFQLRRNSINLDVGGQYNLLFSEARGTYILKLDADDLLLPDMLKRLVETAEQTGAGFVGAAYEWLDVDTGTCRQPAVQRVLPDGPLDDAVRAVLLNNPFHLCFSIWRRSLLPAMQRDNQFVLFTETCDWECQLRIALTKTAFVSVGEVLGLYRLHGSNRSMVTNAQLRSQIGDVLPYWWRPLRNSVDRRALRRYILGFLKGYLKAAARRPSSLDPAILAAFARLLLARPKFPARALSQAWRSELDSPPDAKT